MPTDFRRDGLQREEASIKLKICVPIFEAGMAELADAADSKDSGQLRNSIPLSALFPFISNYLHTNFHLEAVRFGEVLCGRVKTGWLQNGDSSALCVRPRHRRSVGGQGFRTFLSQRQNRTCRTSF